MTQISFPLLDIHSACFLQGVAQWSKERKKPRAAGLERANSSLTENPLERRASTFSLAPSESSRSDLGTRMSTKNEDRGTQYTILQQPKNYFKSVSENKEISKLISLLATSINSTKKVCITPLALVSNSSFQILILIIIPVCHAF